MTQHIFVFDGSSNRKQVQRLFTYDGSGNRKQIQRGFIFDASGNRKQFYSNIAAFLSPLDEERTRPGGASSNIQIRVDTDGYVYMASSSTPTQNVQRFQWRLGGVSADYTVGFVSLAAGTTPSSGPLVGNFPSLSSSQTWANNQAGGGFNSKTSTLNVQIRAAVGGAVLASTTFKLTATVEP
jgi:hypothetical protein